jgi:hypothetical protein
MTTEVSIDKTCFNIADVGAGVLLAREQGPVGVIGFERPFASGDRDWHLGGGR